MYFRKISLNIMTLSGLALGIGMLVDSSIVVLENIFKKRQIGLFKTDAAQEGSEEITLAIIAATITTIVVFLPIVFVNKEIRILYAGLAMTVTFSLLASLFVSLTLVPMLAARLPGGKKKKAKGSTFETQDEASPKLKKLPVRPLQKPGFFHRIYRKFLLNGIRNRYIFLAAACVAFVLVCMFVYPKLQKEFVGTTEQEDFTIFVELPTGAKLDISDQAVKQIEEVLGEVSEMKTFSSRVEPWSSKVYVKLVPIEERKRTTKQVIEELRGKVGKVEAQYKEAFIYFEEPQEVETNEVILEIYGWDYEVLNELAVGMLTRMQTVEGLTDLKLRWRKGRPEWQVVVNKQKAADFNLTVEDVANVLHAKMRGLRATLYHTKAREVEVVARLRKTDRETLDQVRKLTVVLPKGEKIYLEQIADLVPATGPSKIWRKNKNRMIQVSANRGKHPFGTAAELVRQAIQDMEFPEDYHWRFGENYWRMQRNQKELSFALVLTLVLIYLVLAAMLESYAQPFIIMVTVPLAAIGVVIVLERLSKPINVGVLMGSIMLGGIVVNNAIILIDYLNRLHKEGFRNLKATLVAAEARLRPIMMTTCTTILGLLPLAIDRSPEANLWAPLAITVMSGLATSTILTLVIVPCMFLMFEDVKRIFSKLFRRPQFL